MRWLEGQLSRHLLEEDNERQGLSLVLGTDPRHFTIDESEPGRFFFSVARTDNQINETEGDIQAISALRNQCQALISLIRFFQRKDVSTTFSAIQLPDCRGKLLEYHSAKFNYEVKKLDIKWYKTTSPRIQKTG